ncbi:MAG: CpaF family protein, partial [Alphaproteobacteria bacterium]|nr:CpaF family protein [Alphaproteobacteria bacterium]
MAFGKRSGSPDTSAPAAPRPAAPVAQPRPQVSKPKVPDAVQVKGAPKLQATAPKKSEPKPEPVRKVNQQSEQYYATKTTVFNALIDTIDLSQLAQLDAESAREEIRDIVVEIISIKNVLMSISEQEQLLDDICNDVLGYGPLEPLLARDDIADIMV